MSEDNHRWLSTFEDPSQVSVFTQYQALLTSVACVLFYDFLLTLESEVRIVWYSPRTLGKVFFLAIRYGFLLDISLVLFYTLRITPNSGPSMTSRSCQVIYNTATIIQIVNFAAVSAFVALRISALWSRSWAMCIVLFLLGLFNPSTTIPALSYGFDMIPAPWPMFACVQVISIQDLSLIPLVTEYFPLASSAVSIAYEFLCLTLTVIKTISAYREQRRAGMHTTLSGLLIRDGSLYFAVLTALGVFNVVAASLPESPLPNDISVVLSRLFVPILTTRFIANLRLKSRPTPSRIEVSIASESGTLSSMDFIPNTQGSV
ncbi:hypothetical protein OH77DRAFT_1523855 [Trametes cingulata]|nr:hypothetical protein OH77DRAFT_1523855 [Trametes cingulata]